MSKITELLIIGGGPIGLNCALEAEKHHIPYLIIEKGTIVNSLYHYPLYMKFFSTADKLEIAEIPFITTETKPGRREALEYYQGIARRKNLKINLFETVLSVEKIEGTFKIMTDKAEYLAKNVIIATGFYGIPNPLNVPGEDLPKVQHYYKEPYPFANRSVVVAGASNSAIDAALETWRKGATVTMIIKGKEIGSRVKYWVKPDIENRIKFGEIKAFFNSEIVEITEQSVIFRDGNGQKNEIANDAVLAMTGYLPDFQFLANCGIQLHGASQKPYYNEETMETGIPGLYLAGVVCGGRDTHLWFIENSRIHAKIIVDDILKK